MKVLLLGYSNLAKKRIIKTFKKKKIKFYIASKSTKKKIPGILKQFKNYDDGLKKSSADLVYISLPNSMHFYWAKKALNMGYHVVVDKPICKKNLELKKLISISKKNKKLLCEATFFNYHRQFNTAIKLCKGLKNINHIHANFIIPFPKSNSILISKKLDGGVMMDMGPYMSSLVRIFLKGKIQSRKIVIKKNKKNLITAVNLICNNPSKIFSGCFKFGGRYQNELTLYTDTKNIKINRVFSPPDNKSMNLEISENNLIKNYYIKKDNCFANFFTELINKIHKKNYYFYIKRIIEDSNFRNRI